MKNKETGALAIETLLTLTFFMLSIISIMFMAVIIKVQANMQYAISQTAKEISGYYYMIDKIGLASVLSGKANAITTESVEKLNGTIDNFATLVNDSKELGEEVVGLEDINNLTVDELKDIAGDADEIQAKARDLGKELIEQIKTDDAKTQVIAVLKVFGKSFINETFSETVTPFVCKALMPKYLTSGDVLTYCNSAGLNWENNSCEDGKEFMDFSGSELLKDGRSIKIDVCYTINTKNLTFGLVDATLNFHQCATTAAWIKPNGGSLKTLAEVYLANNMVGPTKPEGSGDEGEIAEEGEGE